MTDSREYRLRIGPAVLALLCPDAEFAGALARYFMQPSAAERADVTLDLVITAPGEDRPVPSSLILTKTTGKSGFAIADGLVRGEYDPARGLGRLEVAEVLLRGQRLRVFEQLLYQVFHSACQRGGHDTCLVHSAGVVHGGRGFLCVGPSDAGKTTLAGLADGRVVLNDEMNLVDFTGAAPELVGTPFNGFFRDKRPGRAPLAAVLLLAKGPRHALETVGPGEAAAALASQVAPPVPLERTADDRTPAAMLDQATRIARAVPVRRLTFARAPGFWPLLDTLLPDARG
jgi:hypothetical protein